MRLLLKAEDIPDGAHVYKPGGKQEYILQKGGFKVYDEGGNCQIFCEGQFLLRSAKTINLISPEKELVLEFDTATELIDFLRDME